MMARTTRRDLLVDGETEPVPVALPRPLRPGQHVRRFRLQVRKVRYTAELGTWRYEVHDMAQPENLRVIRSDKVSGLVTATVPTPEGETALTVLPAAFYTGMTALSEAERKQAEGQDRGTDHLFPGPLYG